MPSRDIGGCLGMGTNGRRHSLRRDRELFPCARPPQQRNVEVTGEARDGGGHHAAVLPDRNRV